MQLSRASPSPSQGRPSRVGFRVLQQGRQSLPVPCMRRTKSPPCFAYRADLRIDSHRCSSLCGEKHLFQGLYARPARSPRQPLTPASDSPPMAKPQHVRKEPSQRPVRIPLVRATRPNRFTGGHLPWTPLCIRKASDTVTSLTGSYVCRGVLHRRRRGGVGGRVRVGFQGWRCVSRRRRRCTVVQPSRALAQALSGFGRVLGDRRRRRVRHIQGAFYGHCSPCRV